MRKSLLFFLFLAVDVPMVLGKPSIIPQPVEISERPGVFRLLPEDLVLADGPARRTGEQLASYLRPATGYRLPVVGVVEPGVSASIQLHLDPTLYGDLGDEGYFLSVERKRVSIRGARPAGLFYGCQTLRQLLPTSIFEPTEQVDAAWEIPCVEIKDYPRFSQRGYLLDEARYFKGEEVVKRHLERMALHKMNVFYWHLTDDQGWRVEIKRYPRLTDIGSKREDSQVGGWNSPERSGQPHSGYYTQRQIRDIVEYANDLHITMIPEIEMPGHASAAIAAYPELGTLRRKIKVSVTFGKKDDCFNPADEKVYEALENILSEIMSLFSAPIVHIGGDEVKFGPWQQSAEVKDLMKREGLETLADVQIYFVNRISRFVERSGKRMMGWNDILGHDLHGFLKNQEASSQTIAPNTIIHFWKGDPELAEEAIRKGHDIVMSYHVYSYLDYDYQRIPLRKAYEYEPVAKSLGPGEISKVLGVAACMWGEWIPTVKQMEYQTWPRLCAYAETGWSPEGLRQWMDFRERLEVHLKRLDALGVAYAPLSASDL